MGCAFFPVEMLGTLGMGVLSGSKSNCFAAGIRLLYAAHGEAFLPQEFAPQKRLAIGILHVLILRWNRNGLVDVFHDGHQLVQCSGSCKWFSDVLECVIMIAFSKRQTPATSLYLTNV